MYSPIYTRRFEKQIRKFPKKERIKIIEKIEGILENPRKFITKLESTKPTIYRLRVGEYRVFFGLDDAKKVMEITDVKRRTTQTYS